jgi:CAAX prenyl protease-like protein
MNWKPDFFSANVKGDPAAGQGAGGDETAPPRRETQTADILPYVVPMFIYVALGGVEGYLPQLGSRPNPAWYAGAYAARVAIVAALAFRYRETWKDLSPWPRLPGIVLAVVTGLLVTVLWIGLDPYFPRFGFMGKRTSFDPTGMGALPRVLFYVIRMTGLVLLVPVIEELFWRSFLIRWLIDPDFRRVPIGRVTWISATVTSVLFATAHPEWLPALLTGALWAWLLHQTRSLGACFISHVVANLALGIYVIHFGAWDLW